MNYYINEGIITLPDTDTQDMTLNLINFKNLGTTLVVSRGALKIDENYIENYKSQLEQLKINMKKFKILKFSEDEIMIGQQSDIRTIECHNSFELNNQIVEQYQCITRQRDKMLIFGYSKAGGFNAEAIDHWNAIKMNLVLHSE